MSGLTLSGLYKAYGGHPVLTGLDLAVPSGALVAILGPSGSGKTTLLRVVAGFERADRGRVAIGGTVVEDGGLYIPPERRRTAFVPQEVGLFPHLTASANVGFGLERRHRRARVRELLELVGLAELGGRYPHQLSGGQQQRVALARALAVRPDVVLLDEPFASLDAHLRATLRADVRGILRQAGTTALLVTHDQDEALSMADLVAVIRDGRIAQSGPPEDLYARPCDPDLARFMGQANLVDGRLDGALVETGLGRLPAERSDQVVPGPVRVLIRPEQIDLAPTAQQPVLRGAASSPDGLTGRVVRCDYHGHDAVVYVEPDRGGQPLVVRTMGEPSLAAGAQVALRVRGSVLVWPPADVTVREPSAPVG